MVSDRPSCESIIKTASIPIIPFKSQSAYVETTYSRLNERIGYDRHCPSSRNSFASSSDLTGTTSLTVHKQKNNWFLAAAHAMYNISCITADRRVDMISNSPPSHPIPSAEHCRNTVSSPQKEDYRSIWNNPDAASASMFIYITRSSVNYFQRFMDAHHHKADQIVNSSIAQILLIS